MTGEIDRSANAARAPARAPASATAARRRWVFALACCFYLLTAPGRTGSSDAYSQIQASIVLVRTGWVATDDPDLFDYCSIEGPSGRTYQAHDPGNLVLFVPAAIAAVASGQEEPEQKVPLIGRLVASLTYAVVGALLVTSLFVTLERLLPFRAAIAGTILAGCATPIWVYSRCTMDVLPAALGMSLTMNVLLAQAEGRVSAERAAVLAGLTVGMTGWFRASALPFVTAPAMIALFWNAGPARWRAAAIFTVTLTVLFSPVLFYNYIRTGNPLVLGTGHARYRGQNALEGDFLTGIFGMTFAPNHGVFVFAPWLILALTGLGLASLSARIRVVLIGFLVGAGLYACMIAGMSHWGKPEWGPRYMVPMLPALIAAAAVAGHRLWQTRGWAAVAALAVLSLAVSVPAGIVNYSEVVTEYPGALDALAPTPRQIQGSYHFLFEGLAGRGQPRPVGAAADPDRAAEAKIPDWWTARLVERGGVLALAGYGIGAVLLLGAAASGWRLFRISGEGR